MGDARRADVARGAGYATVPLPDVSPLRSLAPLEMVFLFLGMAQHDKFSAHLPRNSGRYCVCTTMRVKDSPLSSDAPPPCCAQPRARSTSHASQPGRSPTGDKRQSLRAASKTAPGGRVLSLPLFPLFPPLLSLSPSPSPSVHPRAARRTRPSSSSAAGRSVGVCPERVSACVRWRATRRHAWRLWKAVSNRVSGGAFTPEGDLHCLPANQLRAFEHVSFSSVRRPPAARQNRCNPLIPAQQGPPVDRQIPRTVPPARQRVRPTPAADTLAHRRVPEHFLIARGRARALTHARAHLPLLPPTASLGRRPPSPPPCRPPPRRRSSRSRA